jgi:NifU-like protein involved in Fe-S cluster formation
MNPTEDFSNSIEEAIKHPKNLGELDGADAVGTVIAVASVATELIPGKTVEESHNMNGAPTLLQRLQAPAQESKKIVLRPSNEW